MLIFSVNSDVLKFGDRLVPGFYYYTKEIKARNIRNGIQYIKLGEYAEISDGEHSAIPRNSKGGIRYLYGRNIKEGVVDFDPITDDPYIDEYDYNAFPRCHIRPNDVLIAIYGTVGKSAVYREEYIGKAGIPRHISNITLNSRSPITPEYLTAFFRSKYGKWQIFSLMTGNIQQLLSLKNLKEFDIPVVDKDIIAKVTALERMAIDCEIKAQAKIKEAQNLLYKGLNFDVQTIKRDFTFTIRSSAIDENNIWLTGYYDNLYVKMENALKELNGVKPLRALVNICHGDEVGSENYKEFVDRSISDIPFIRTSDIVNHEVDRYPDYYVEEAFYKDFSQDVKKGDILFTKDGKIACTGMVTESDKVILSSGIERLRIKPEAIKEGFTPEYIFTALSIPEIGRYAAIRRTVIASTIPHLRPERLKDISIPIINEVYVHDITKLISEAFKLKNTRKEILKQSDAILEKLFLG